MSSTDLQKTRRGLTTAEAEKMYEEVGFNELPHIEVSLWWIFFVQFTGLMPYMLELACVLALAVQSYIDFAIIAAILFCNGYLGFHEELKAKASLEALTEKMEQKIAVLRDGQACHLLTRLLVPGDVVLLVGGVSVPADVEWIEGDILSVDTAALTGEPLPRKYPSEDHGKLILCGCTVAAGEAYCVVRKTGINTEIGSSQAAIMQDKAGTRVSVFEERVLHALKIIILAAVVDVLIIFLVQGIARKQFESNVRELIATCLSIIIASVPVALPLVLQVTMALGAAKMAREFNAVVTSLPALQDISSMSVLCSDKTGTLTTAKISINAEAIWCNDGYNKNDVAFYAALSSNRDKKEDPIDRSVIQFFDKIASPPMIESAKAFKLIRSVGFNPIYKRVLWQYSHPSLGKVTIVKGLPNKVIDTADGGEDDAEDQFKVENYKAVLKQVHDIDGRLSKAGYKTLGVSIQIGEDAPFKFVGILPMIDPPRHDSAQTIRNLKAAGVSVKMITGDHLNIAKETARLIGMGTNIHKGEEVRVASQVRDEMIMESDGFAQVLPRDKREVVLVLKKAFNKVVGMTGDGVNDAPALSAAQCGIAVDDATDAAKNAAAIILTTPGLSAIYSGIIESRRIFRKLKAYIIYRFAVTIQIVTVLTLLIYISNCPINALYIILLALFNDLTLLPIAYDRQDASATPEFPHINPILILSLSLGAIQVALTLLWAYASHSTGFFKSDFDCFQCSTQAQSGVWVQMFISAELLIFSTRAPQFFLLSLAPTPWLVFSVLLGCLIISVFACAIPFFGHLWVQDVAIIWLYNIICLVVVDCVKLLVMHLLGESFEVLDVTDTPDHAEHASIPPAPETSSPVQHGKKEFSQLPDKDIEMGSKSEKSGVDDEDHSSKASAAIKRMDTWSKNQLSSAIIGADINDLHSTNVDRSASTSNISINRKLSSSAAIIAARRTHSAVPRELRHAERVSTNEADQVQQEVISSAWKEGKITVPRQYALAGSTTDLRHGLGATTLRPYTPANKVSRK